MKLAWIALVGIILCGCGAATPDTFSGEPLSGQVERRSVATLSRSTEVLISDDLAHVAVIDQHGQKQRLTVDGKAGPESEVIRFVKHDGPLFGHGGIPALYARADRGRWRLVANGQSGPECDAWIDQTSCGSDRAIIAYTAVEIERKAFVAIDGQPGPIYTDVSCPALSPDRMQLAYVTCTGQGQQRKYIPIINGHAGPEYDEIAIPSSGVWSVFSADNKRTAYVARLGLKWRTVIDGQAGAEYDEIAPDSLAFSPDSRRVAYAARSGAKWCVVLDGQPGQQHDGIGPDPIRFFPNANDIAYTALVGPQWLAIIGDQPPITCDEIADLTVSPGGLHVAFVGRKGAKWQAIIDGNAGPEYDQIGLPEHERFWVSLDGKRLAYAGRLGSKWHVVVDGRPNAACDEIQQDGTPFFSPDGKRTAYTARIGAGWSVVIDGQPGPSYDKVERDSFEFSDDGVRTAYAARQGDKWQVVIDNQAGTKYDDLEVSSRIFTQRGKRAAYAAIRKGKWCVVINGEEGPKYDDVSELLYSPDGKRMAYVAGRIVDQSARDQSLVLDGEAGPWYQRIGGLYAFCGSSAHVSSKDYGCRPDTANGKSVLGHENIYGVVFSPDGKHVAYPAGKREAAIIHDGKPGPTYYSVGTPVFSADSKRLAYTASVNHRDESKQLVVIDGKPSPVYDKVELPRGQGASCFSPDGKHTVYAARKNAQWHAVVDSRDGPACDAFFGPGSTTSYGQPAAYASWRSVTWRGAAKEQKLYESAPEYDHFSFQPLFFGADAGRVVYAGIVQTQARVRVVSNEAPGPEYDQVGKPVVSSDGRRVAYIACRGRGENRKFVAVIDGQEGPEYDEIPLNRGGEWEPFSRGGQHSAYMGRTGLKWRAVIDGQPGPEYDEVYPVGLVRAWYGFFSADGKRTAYFARQDGKWRAVIDGREGPTFEYFINHFQPLTFSPDGNHVAYVAQWGQGPRHTYRAIIDGQQGPEYATEWVAGVVFSPDGRRTAYVGQRDNNQFVVLDGKELPSYDGVDSLRLVFSPDSQRLAYIAYRGRKGDRKAHFVVDGKEGPEHGDEIETIRFSPDSKHVAYLAINGRWQDKSHTEQLMVDGEEGPVVDEVNRSSIQWSSNSKHLAYVAEDRGTNGWNWVILDGKAQPKFRWVSDVTFSPDGEHLAYKARGDWAAGCVVVRDGQPGPVFDDIEWLPSRKTVSFFTPDSRHVIYQAKQAGKWVVVLDGQPGHKYDSVLHTWFRLNGWPYEQRPMWPPRILPDGAIQYPAMTGGNPVELYIVTQRPSAK